MLRLRMATQSRGRVCGGCSAQIKGKIRKGMCENCYRLHLRRERSAGLRKPAAKRKSWDNPAQAVLAAVQRDPNGCWLYTGTLDRDGYAAHVTVVGYPRTRAHRATYEHFVGPIPGGMQLDHLCHKPETCAGGPTCPHRRCVNPAHLKPVTGRENTLRSNSVPAINARKTHCNNGHPYTPENTQVRVQAGGRTWRRCRECQRATRNASRKRQLDNG